MAQRESIYWSLVEPVWEPLNRSWESRPEEFSRQLRAVPPAVGHLYAGHWCQSEVCNGGFHQFFHNSTGVLAPEALEGFRAVGLAKCTWALADAMAFFGSTYPRERAERIERLASRRGRRRQEWDPFYKLDGRFYEEAERWADAADNYARQMRPSVLEESIGIQTLERPFMILLRRGTALPASHDGVFSTGVDNQSAAALTLVAGDPIACGPARCLGKLVLVDLPTAPRATLHLELGVSVGERGDVSVWARHPGTGDVVSATLSKVAVKPA
jgi:hypothetical protein